MPVVDRWDHGAFAVAFDEGQRWWVLRSWWWSQGRSSQSRTVSRVRAQSSRWSFSRNVERVQPSTTQVGYSHSSALCCFAFARRPRWATPATCSPLVAMAARNGSAVSIRSRITEVATGP
jgi:hypothetical protein